MRIGKALFGISLVCLMAVLLSANLVAQDTNGATKPQRMAVVDLNEVFNNYRKAIDIDNAITERFKAEREDLEERIKHANELKDRILAFEDPTAPELAALKEEHFLTMKEVDFKKKRLAQTLALESAEQTYKVYQEIRDMIAVVSKEKGYDFVLKVDAPEFSGSDRLDIITRKINSRPVLYHNPEYDITKLVTDRLNAAYDKQKPKDGEGGE